MTWFDSHLHFDSFVEKDRLDDLLQNAEEAGVTRITAIGGSIDANALAVRLAGEYPERIYASVGFDRDEAGKEVDGSLLRKQLTCPGVVATGETGLDYHYGSDTAADQKKLFQLNLEAAAAVGKPVVVHSREADEDTLGMLKDFTAAWSGDPSRPGVLHCYTGDIAFARHLLDLGMMISFSGILTFRNAERLREVAAFVPEDRMLIETDAPYLAPVPYRGKRNEAAYVVEVGRKLAEVRGTGEQDVAALTTRNALFLFGID